MATITSLASTDNGSTSRSTINTNFTNLNTDKSAVGFLVGFNAAFTQDFNLSRFLHFWATGVTATEAQAQIKIPVAATYKDLKLFIDTNTLNNDCVLTVRKNGADQSITFTIGASATGWFEDSANAFSAAAGDLISVGIDTTAAGSGTITIRTWQLYCE